MIDSNSNKFLQTLADVMAGVPNFGRVTAKLTRSGQPSEKGFTYLVDKGVDVIFKLDSDTEFSDKKEKDYFKGTIVNYPLNVDHLTETAALSIASTLDSYLKDGKKVHVHCKWGRDRTGLVIGTWRIKFQGVTYDQVKDDWKEYGTPLPQVKAILKQL